MLHAHRRLPLLLAVLGASGSAALLAPASSSVLSAAAAAGEPVARAAQACPGARARITKAAPRKLRSALLCLVNRKRAANGLKALRLDRKLQRAAGRHARDMVKHDYFAHQRDGGPDLSTRLDRAGWEGTAWGETIAYGCGSSGSPRATLKGWMHSPPHRDILLSGTYRRGGLGVGADAPCGDGGATWVLDVGRK
jgi:uncharacterized protein YkwD